MSRQALIIFVKNPQLGKVKTRLAATVGDERALEIYKVLLEHTMKSTVNLRQDKYVYYSEQVSMGDLWSEQHYHKQVQSSGDLGQKMNAAFKQCFAKGFDKVCIIGSDLIEMSEDIIRDAFDTLNSKDVVIGPASDGGYYLLGMSKLYAQLFNNKNWSTETVLQDTIKNIEVHNLSYRLLPELNDIDTEEDWEEYLLRK